MFDTVCVGVIVTDLITSGIDRLPEKGKLMRVGDTAVCSGGCAFNAAVDMAKMGAKTAIIGRVGNDCLGGFIADEAKKNGVDSAGLSVSESVATSSSMVLVSSDGERSFLFNEGANGEFSEGDIDYSIIDRTDIVFVGGFMLMSAFDGEQCAEFLRKCKEMNKITVLDTAWNETKPWMDNLRPCLPYVDYFIPSIEEAEMFSGEKELKKIADCFFDCGAGHVVIKTGGSGCYMRETKASEGVLIPAYKVNTVDTTGAGDSFCAGFLYGLSRGMTMLESCRLGNAVGAHCVSAVGSSTGIKSYEEIKAFMGDR